MFFGPVGKTRWPPWPLIGLDIFDFSSETAEQNSTKLDREARSQRPLPSLCFSARLEKQDGRPGLWLAETFSTFPLKPLNRFQQNLTGSKISKSSTKFVFFGLISKQMSTLADSSKRWHIVLRCTIWLGYCFTPYQRLRLYNGAPFSRLLRHAGDTEDVFSA